MDSSGAQPRKPFKLYFWTTVIIACLTSYTAGIMFAWTGPILEKLTSTDPNVNPIGRPITVYETSWVGSLFGLGALLGITGTGALAGTLGRKYTLYICGIIYIVALMVLAFAKHIYLFYFGRLIAGMGLSNVLAILPMYLSEIAETYNRGTVMAMLNLLLGLGSLFVFIVGPFVSVMAFSLICAIAPIVFVVIFPFFPETPYFLVYKKKREKAERKLMLLRAKTQEEVQEELNLVQKTIDTESATKASFAEFCTVRKLRRGLFIAMSVRFFLQASGLTAIQFYVTRTLKLTGSSLDPDYSAMAVAVFRVAGGSSGTYCIDKFGRKPMLLVSGMGMAVGNLMLAIFFFIKDGGANTEKLFWFPVTSMCIYIYMANIGYAPISWNIVGEMIAVRYKPVAAVIVVSFNWLLGFLVSKCFPVIGDLIGYGPVYLTFAILCVLGFVYTLIFMIETKGKTFIQIEEELSM